MKYFTKKFIALIITLLIVSFLAFLAFTIIPGDPTTRILGTEATPERVAQLRELYGLDKPFFQRYFGWLTDFVKGDFGTSYVYSMPVREMLGDKLPTTGLLVLLTFTLTVLLSIPLGIAVGHVKNNVLDKIIAALDQFIMSIPTFFVGVLICYLFGITLRLFVPGQFVSYKTSFGGCLQYLIFPALSIAIPKAAMTIKMLRGSILDELSKDYVRTARSRGNLRSAIINRHVVRNALIPVITFLAVSMAEIVTSSIIIEQIFTIPGIGRLMLASINSRDFPVVQAIVVILAAWIVSVNFLADILNQAVDPRMRLK